MKPVIRAPGGHGELACDPPMVDLPGLLMGQGSNLLDTSGWQWSLRRQARREFLGELPGNETSIDPEKPWVGTGHQPELFHPGVWAKNFVAGGMASSLGTTSFHVVIDTDSPKEMGIRLPDLQLTEQARRARLCLFANSKPGTPWAQIAADPVSLPAFSHQIEAWVGQADFLPLAKDWLRIFEQKIGLQPVGPTWTAFHHARSRVEEDWGLRQPFLPMSRVAGFPSFLELVRRFLMDARRARMAYNQALDNFRSFHQLETPGRPVPFLEEREDGWGEAPLWLILNGSESRGRLWVKEEQGAFYLTTDPQGCHLLTLKGDLETGLARLVESGVRLWPRALFTTLYLRAFVFDWFVHGIGGALYDQVSEDWALRWLKLTPGPLVAASLTLRLPLYPARSGTGKMREAEQFQRHQYWNPDRLLESHEKKRHRLLLDELRALRDDSPKPGIAAKNRFHRIRRLLEALRGFTQGRLEESLTEVGRLRHFSQEEQLVNNREYAYLLHPVESLRKHLQPLLNLRETAATN